MTSSSPLDVYRKKASFCPKAMKSLIEGEEHIKYKEEFTKILEKDPLFARDFSRPSLQEAREITHQRWKKIIEYDFVEDPMMDSDKFMALAEILEMYDQGLAARLTLHTNVFISALMSMGTKRHEEILEKAKRNQIVGCFCLTELSHGSNTQLMQTTATFDNGQFVFNSPNEGSIKVWAGNLAFSATHAIVFAQLITQGKSYGLHAFVLQVRDFETFKTLPGITIGDMGEKPGAWNAVENGWMEFKNHRAPLWTLLNKGVDVTDDGKYVSSYKSTSERQSVSLGALSIGRLGIIGKGIHACAMASTIAIRYSAARQQFGPPGEEEIPVIEYPLQQHRLLPYLAAHITTRIFHRRFVENFKEYMIRMIGGEKTVEMAEYSKEVHALSSAAKPVSTWLGIEALGEARRACGGHGFLYSSRLNELRDSYDPSQTFEGENNILLQQTSNILVSKKNSKDVSSPMGTYAFLNDKINSFTQFSPNPIQDILKAYKWLIQYLIQRTNEELELNKSKGVFNARNYSQIYAAHPLSIAYAEHTILNWFNDFVKDVEDLKIKKVLEHVGVVYGSFVLEKHMSYLYIGGYCNGPAFGLSLQKARKEYQELLFPEVMSLVDVIAPPDFILHSTLGTSDGKAYENLMTEFRKNEYESVRPNWWKDLAHFLKSTNHTSKL